MRQNATECEAKRNDVLVMKNAPSQLACEGAWGNRLLSGAGAYAMYCYGSRIGTLGKYLALDLVVVLVVVNLVRYGFRTVACLFILKLSNRQRRIVLFLYTFRCSNRFSLFTFQFDVYAVI